MKDAFLRGTSHLEVESTFEGHATFELRADCVYYTWRLEEPNGKFLAQKSQPVSLRVIPAGQDPYSYALQHAVEGINSYRINRKKCFHVQHYEWKE